MTTFVISIVVFTTIILALVAVLLLAKAKLVISTAVDIVFDNDETHPISVSTGDTLLNTLASQKIFLPSACGGKGSCGACKVTLTSGSGKDLLPSERALVTQAEARRGVRLACQTKVKEGMSLQLPPSALQAHSWVCTVRSNHNLASFIKELVLELPEGESVPFRAGGYIQVQCPPYQFHYADFDIDPRYHDRWDQLGLWNYTAQTKEAKQRSYSMASYPGEEGVLIFNVRIAPPPPELPDVPPGIVSSYIFSLKPGDTVNVIGPFGDFFAREGDTEMVFIVGGAGMAPMRSHIFDQLERLRTNRKISFWYGARSLCEAFYLDDFDRLAREHDNFAWTLALSITLPQDNWSGPRGFIHQVVLEQYLINHPAPEDVEYYLCGPPAMIGACQQMLAELGVEPENILFDKFG